MKLRLTDLITDKISGEWGKEATPTSGVKVIRAANFTKEGVINYDNLVFREIEPSKVDSKRLQFGDIIIEKSGGSPNQPVGRVVFFDLKTSDPFLCNNFTSVLRPNKKLVDPKYLFYRLSDWHKQGKTLRHQNKTTGIINLKLDRYLEEEIEIPVKIEDQIRLANTLDKAQALISQRKESLRLLDEFLKSTFLEMFGDPVKNEKGWKIVPIGDHVDVLTGFAFKSKEYSTDRRGIPLCGGLIIQPDTIEWQKANFWSKDNIRGLDRYFLNQDDVVIAMDRPWISTGFKIRMINKNDPPALLVQRTARLRSTFFDQHFLYYMFRHKSFETHCKPTETTVPHISPNDIKTFRVPMPPQELQKAFSEVSKKIGSLRIQYQSSLQELEKLYSSLSQNAFKGELLFNLNSNGISLPINEKEEDYFKKRKALACYIINKSLDDDKFGDTKFEKLLFLSDYIAIKRNLGQHYYQKVAGPYDNAFTNTFYVQIQNSKLFKRKRTKGQTAFVAGANHNKSLATNAYFSSEELERVNRLVNLFKKSDYEQPEIIATLYAVWNNRIIRQQEITDELLKEDFLKWDTQKIKYKDRLDKALSWMRTQSIVPDGWGRIVDPPKASKTKSRG